MSEIHPPESADELRFEEEMNREAKQPAMRKEAKQPSPETEADKATEEAMHLGR